MKAQITDDMKEKEKHIQVLKQTELCGQQFKVYGTAAEPLFLATGVAEIIGHTNVSEMLRAVDEDEKLTSVIFRAGQNRSVWMLTEDGLYEVLMQSRKPIAKQFKKGVVETSQEQTQTIFVSGCRKSSANPNNVCGGQNAWSLTMRVTQTCVSPKIEVTLPRPSIVAAASQPNRVVPAFFNARTCVYNGFAPPCYGLMPVTAATGEGQRDRRDRFSSTRNANNVYNVR